MTQMPPPQPPMGAPGAPGGAPMQPHRGTMLLIFGILGFVCCVIFGILAWSMGGSDLKKMDAGQMDPSGRGLTQAAKVLGMINVILAVVGMIIYAIIFAVALSQQ